MTVYIGTSGWQYQHWREAFYPRALPSSSYQRAPTCIPQHWREAFYPRALPQKDWLPYFAERFQVVEVNNTFYRLPRPQVFADWRQRTPGDFRFALKMSRYLTHLKRLREPEEPVARFLRAAGELKEKMGPILLQLPPNMEVDVERLRAALKTFPEQLRVAVEFRDDSWYTEAVHRALSERNVALCLADRGEELITPEWRTTDWGYVRFHEGRGDPGPCYSDACLADWAARLARLWQEREDVYVFFNNDACGCALRDVIQLATELGKVRRTVSRAPASEEINVVA